MRKKYYVIGEREGERERTLAKRENSQPSRSAKNAHPFCMVDFLIVRRAGAKNFANSE